MSDYFGLYPAEILLPRAGFSKWAVIACDQHTAEPEYWERVEEEVGDAPSALRLILPEIYLGEDDAARTDAINRAMARYLRDGTLVAYPNSMIYLERETSGGTRRGIVGAVDLDEYDFTPGAGSLIRATERTVPERLPPRVAIRENAPLELPHVLLLIDDPDFGVIEPLSREKDGFRPAYDFSLMMGGGAVRGYFIPEARQRALSGALRALVDGKADPFLFAVGDGNHSLAAAKECRRKRPTPLNRYALVEVVNLRDPAISFEPIYRVLYCDDPAAAARDFSDFVGGEYSGDGAQEFTLLAAAGEETLSVRPRAALPVGTLQDFLDEYTASHTDCSVDYIHGDGALRALTARPGALGFLFRGMKKGDLFPAVAADGCLPRKTFSMGEARDKRYYIECRRISDS